MKKIPLNFGWEFIKESSDRFIAGDLEADSTVDIPHTFAVTPFNYFDESVYQGIGCYRTTFRIPEEWENKRIFINVGAAAHKAEIYANGTKICTHLGGYTAFSAELTGHVTPGEPALIAITVDSNETLDVPPFGHVVDYMTYGGIYREVSLYVCEKTYIDDLFVIAKVPGTVSLFEGDGAGEIERVRFDGEAILRIKAVGDDADTIRVTICDTEGNSLESNSFPVSDEVRMVLTDAKLWDVVSPALYKAKVELMKGNTVLDEKAETFGFRRAEFLADGFYLNGRKLKLVGLDRHQSYPYVGYAMPESAQRLDAEILKNELGVNIVRTSHYPQSPRFIDRCDEIGLLVFTEIPGWQHIGGTGWKRVAVENVREMVTQYRNHPSIILWGVRINESEDDDDFYKETNSVARSLDETRQTAGVRRLKRGNLLEDVFTYNDFVHEGDNKGCEKKRDVTSDMSKGYLITEFNGHMFPTKSFDSENHRLEHALRHANVIDAALGENDISGCLGWCMFDYNTHRDFGSGDRVCYHGVLDMFRNPKTASYVYSEMREGEPFLEVSSTMDIGEHPAGKLGTVWAFTNAESVKMFKNGVFIREFTHADSPYKNIKNPPIPVNDFVGDRIKEGEGFSPRRAKYTKDILNYAALNGFSKLPLKIKLKAAYLMVFHRMTFNDAYSLYGKYIGNWGDEVTEFRFEAVEGGTTVKTLVKSPVTKIVLEAVTDHTDLCENETYDVASIRLRAKDQSGNVLPYLTESVSVTVSGPIEILGETAPILRGGLGGTYVRTNGESGDGKVTLTLPGAEPVTVDFTVKKM